MSAPMNHPPYENFGEQPQSFPEDPRWVRGGTYVEPTYADLSAAGIPPAPEPAARAAFAPPTDQLSEEDNAPGRRATSSDVDHHIYTGQYHGPAYGELGPRPYPN